MGVMHHIFHGKWGLCICYASYFPWWSSGKPPGITGPLEKNTTASSFLLSGSWVRLDFFQPFGAREPCKPGYPCSANKDTQVPWMIRTCTATCLKVSPQQFKNMMCCCITIQNSPQLGTVSISKVYFQSIQAARHWFCTFPSYVSAGRVGGGDEFVLRFEGPGTHNIV